MPNMKPGWYLDDVFPGFSRFPALKNNVWGVPKTRFDFPEFEYFMSINWRASLVPAAAAIPAPIAYIYIHIYIYYIYWNCCGSKARSWNSVEDDRSALWVCIWLSLDICTWLCGAVFGTFNVRKLDCFKQACALNTLAWNNKIGPQFYFVGFYSWGMDW